jgi:hypothetical protein
MPDLAKSCHAAFIPWTLFRLFMLRAAVHVPQDGIYAAPKIIATVHTRVMRGRAGEGRKVSGLSVLRLSPFIL